MLDNHLFSVSLQLLRLRSGGGRRRLFFFLRSVRFAAQHKGRWKIKSVDKAVESDVGGQQRAVTQSAAVHCGHEEKRTKETEKSQKHEVPTDYRASDH